MKFYRTMIPMATFCIALLVGFRMGEKINPIESLIQLSLKARPNSEIIIPNNNQFNLLIIGLADEKSPAAELESIWLAAYSRKSHKITFMPIFPLENEALRNQQLAEAFSLEQGEPGQAFWEVLQSAHLWWGGYITSDRQAAIELVDLLGGIYIDDELYRGQQIVSDLPNWQDNPQTTLNQQKLILEGICNRLVQTNHLKSSTWGIFFSPWQNSNTQTILHVLDWGKKLREYNDFSCEFPTFDEAQARLLTP